MSKDDAWEQVEKKADARYVRVDVDDAKGKKLLHHFIRDNKWGSPAGRIEEGEDPAQAAVRELLERTGYEGVPEDLSPRGIDDGTHVYSVALEKLKQVAKPGERGGYSTKIKLAADKMRTVELSGKVQGVGLRKTVHSKLDELGREGLAVNDARTGKVHMTVPEDVMESVLDAVRVQVKKRGAPEPIVRQVKEKPKLRKTRLSPKQVEDFSTRGGLSRLAARGYAEKLKWLVDRYRLKEEEKGGLVGRLPALARKQVRVQEPIYEGQLSHPEDYFEDGPRPVWAKKAADKTKHVLVTGHSGSGKTTLSKQLAEELGLPLFGLDDDPRWDKLITDPEMDDVARNTPGTPANIRFNKVRKQMVLDALARVKPHVIEGTQIAGSPEVWKDHRLVHVDTPELQVVRQRLGRDRLKPHRAGKMPPGSPMARERARIARVMIAGMRDELAQVAKDPRWERMRAKKASVLDGVIEKKAENPHVTWAQRLLDYRRPTAEALPNV